MELRVLNYFLMVAREENITKAANLLHITQPTLSRQLSQLEEELGVKLFKRTNHKIILTEEGMMLRRRAQEIIILSNKIKSEISHEEEALTGEISIGCGELNSVDELADIIHLFQKEHPLVKFEIHSSDAMEIKQDIENGLLDFGLLIEPVEIGKYEFKRMTKKETWGILVRKDSSFSKLEFITPEELSKWNLMMPRSDSVKGELVSWFGDYAPDLKIVSTYNLLYNSTVLVRKNVGLAVCLKLDALYEDLQFIPFFPTLNLSSVIAWKANQVFSPTTAEFVRFVQKYFKSISGYKI